jgi:hypothetical protein
LIDASGHIKWVARQLNIKLSPYYSICYGEFLNGCSCNNNDTFYFFASNSRFGKDGGWFYPIKEKQAIMGYAQIAPSHREPFWRTLSHFEKTWIKQTDEDWDKFIGTYKKIPAEKQLQLCKYNSVPLFQKLYSVIGYLRRGMLNKMKACNYV